MRLTATIQGDLREITAGEVRKGKRAVSMAMAAAGAQVKDRWRDQIAAADFKGNVARLQRTVRHGVYPKGRQSLNAATMIWSNAPNIMLANETGAVIRSANGFWLAIPTDAAGKGAGGRKMTPANWERKTGRELQFVYRKGRTALLVDTGRAGRGNQMVKRAGKLQSPRTYKNRYVVMFVLVPQVRLRKRLSVYAMAAQVGATLPARVAALWRD